MITAHRVATVVTPLDLILALLALASGVELGPLLLPRDLTVQPAAVVQMTPVADPWFDAPADQQPARVAVTPARTASAVESVTAARTPSSPQPSSERAPVRRSSPPTCSCDWRHDLQHLAAWSHPAEAPAGANRYPIAVPDGRQREDLPHP